MKKFLVVLLILAVAGGGLFAQELKFTGHVRTGVMAWFGDGYNNPAFIVRESDPQVAFRAELNGTYTTAAGNAGGFFRVRYIGADSAGTTSITWGPTNIWFKPMNNDMLLIRAGNLDNNSFGTMGGIDTGGDVGSGNSVLFESRPMDGLILGFGINPLGKFDNSNYRFGVKYTMANTFAFALNAPIGASNGSIRLNAGVDILALKDMGFTKLALDASLIRLDKLSDAGTVIIGQQVTFVSGDFTAGLRAKEYLPMGAPDNSDLRLTARVYGQYKMGDITPRLDVGFGMNNKLKDPFDCRAWEAVDGGLLGKDHMSIVINPNIACAVGGGTITLGYSFMMQTETEIMRNAVYAAFIVNF